jgi:hypothetical protein
MKRKSVCFLWSILLLGGWLFSSCSTLPQPGAVIDPIEYPFLRQANGRDDMVWRKVTGPGFDVFYGNPQENTACGFGFFIGAIPNFSPPTNAVVVSGALGVFPVEWYETVDANPPQFHREAVLEYRTRATWVGDRESKYTERIHVWIYGATERQVLDMLDFLDGLELFRHKPESAGNAGPFGPATAVR